MDALNLHGKVPLMAAAKAGHVDALQALLACGAQLDLQSNMGATALMVALMSKQWDSAVRPQLSPPRAFNCLVCVPYVQVSRHLLLRFASVHVRFSDVELLVSSFGSLFFFHLSLNLTHIVSFREAVPPRSWFKRSSSRPISRGYVRGRPHLRGPTDNHGKDFGEGYYPDHRCKQYLSLFALPPQQRCLTRVCVYRVFSVLSAHRSSR